MSTHPVHVSEIKKVHFIGIGGIGMSALARLFLAEKKLVSGSDRSPSAITEALRREGALVYASQVRENITPGIDLIVYTEAMSKEHEEMVAARALGVPMMNYFEALGMIANEYYLIAVAGAHGKTTTTAMLIDIFEDAGFDPSAIVGSLRTRTKSNYRQGKSKYFIVEACEYKRDFLSLTPDILVITNVEYEHVDYYTSLEDVQAAFREFALQVRDGGAVIVNFGAPNIAPILQGVTAKLIDYGKYMNPLRRLQVPGLHNQLNAAAAVAAAAEAGIEVAIADTSLAKFSGTWRRFEYKGELSGAKIYDDYGHHPSEIRATLQGARELYPDKTITVVFQPHTYTRTQALFDDFVQELAKADKVILLPIYAARETNESGVSSEQLVERIGVQGTDVAFSATLEDAASRIRASAGPNDVVLIMGAGSVTNIGTMLTA